MASTLYPRTQSQHIRYDKGPEFIATFVFPLVGHPSFKTSTRSLADAP